MKALPERRLWLIKHAMPVVELDRPAHEWRLGAEGQLAASRLAQRLASETGLKTGTIFSSPEPKAQETAAILGEALNWAIQVHPALHEHLRPLAPQREQGDFQASVARLFAEPGEIVFGSESANQAYERFGRAVDEICAVHDGDVCIVAHGTVISLLASRRCGLDGYALWRRLGLPSVVSIHLPGYRLGKTIETIE